MHDDYIRVAALWHEALGVSRVKVIFRDGGHDAPTTESNEAAYFMDRETYREIPLGETATLADYKKFADNIVEAQNLDIYSNQ